MKKLCAVLLVALSGHCAWALPKLQLDVDPGTWDPVSQTTIANSNPFTLRALISQSFATTRTFYISAAIIPGSSNPNFGSFSINGNTYSSSSGMQFGTPPVDASINDLGGHDVFPTWYTEVAFSIVPTQQVAAYDVQDDSADPSYLYFVDFNINIAGLLGQPNSPFAVHFDLYTYDDGGKKIFAFAPFSHDAESSHGIIVVPEPSPEPVPDSGTSISLLGGAVAGLLGLRRSRWLA